MPPQFSTQSLDMCHAIIDSNLIEIQSQPNRKSGTLLIADGFVIKNRHLYYTFVSVQLICLLK